MSFGSELDLVAVDALNEFGQSITYTKVASGAYDPSTSTATDVPTTATFKAYLEDARDLGFGVTLTENTTKRMTVAASSLPWAPLVGDAAEASSGKFVVNNVITYQVGEVAVLYVIDLRKG